MLSFHYQGLSSVPSRLRGFRTPLKIAVAVLSTFFFATLNFNALHYEAETTPPRTEASQDMTRPQRPCPRAAVPAARP